MTILIFKCDVAESHQIYYNVTIKQNGRFQHPAVNTHTNFSVSRAHQTLSWIYLSPFPQRIKSKQMSHNMVLNMKKGVIFFYLMEKQIVKVKQQFGNHCLTQILPNIYTSSNLGNTLFQSKVIQSSNNNTPRNWIYSDVNKRPRELWPKQRI
ncbi:Hypothetical_protein [Hexamita inflata]|uniref:Hypothetical_protein n=1 Tax=Hexamita inflata TaxID=28002 RepID=A0AA86R7R8_9EUKA|nr:Hypothetical protein HINF_LOCUS59855 [Hexamita inflata]